MLLTGMAHEMRETRAWHLEVGNVYNPANVGTLRITAKVTLLRLRYAGLRWHEQHRSTIDPRSALGTVALPPPHTTAPAAVSPPTVGLAEAPATAPAAAPATTPATTPAAAPAATPVTTPATAAAAPSAAGTAPADASAVSGASAAAREAKDSAVDAAAAAAAVLEAEDRALDAILSEARRAGLVLPDGGGVLAAIVPSPLVCPVLPTSPICSATFELHNCSREHLPLLLSVTSELEPAPVPEGMDEDEVGTSAALGTNGSSGGGASASGGGGAGGAGGATRSPYVSPNGVSAEALEWLRQGISFELLITGSSTPVSEVTLAPDERLELTLLVHPSASASFGEVPLQTPLLAGLLHVQTDETRLTRPTGSSASGMGAGMGAPVDYKHVPGATRAGRDARISREERISRDELASGAVAGAPSSSGLALNGVRLGIQDTLCVVLSVQRGFSFTLNVSQLNFHGTPRLISPAFGPSSPPPQLAPAAPLDASRSPPWTMQSPPLSPALKPSAMPAQVESLWVRNPSVERALWVRIEVEFPTELGLLHVEPERARVLPGEELQVRVRLTPRGLASPPGSLARLRVIDEAAPECTQDVRVVLLERRVGRRELLDEPGAALGDGPSADSLSGLPGAQHGALRRHDLLGGSLLAPPGSGQLLPGALEEPSTALGLRGVTPIGGSTHRYEVNLGHQSYGSGRVQWELWVENLGVTPLRYRVFPLTTEEGDWVSL